MIIKVCGMREPENIRAVEALGADWLGFIFWPASSRYVGSRPSYLPVKARRVGVFVDEQLERVREMACDYGLDYLQLHGKESPEYVAQLSQWKVIKAISISGPEDLAACEDYEGRADYFLFDTKCMTVGGSGQHFDWSVLSAYKGNTPFLLSGGIGPNDAGSIKAFQHPRCVGIDLNSRFETVPGLKDIQKLKQFFQQL